MGWTITIMGRSLIVCRKAFLVWPGSVPHLLPQFAIELYPVLDRNQADSLKTIVNGSIAVIEPVYIRFGVINGIIDYNV